MNTILLVEDNPHIMKINYTSLLMEGYRVLCAETAAQCLQTLRANDVDLVILDVMLPDGNGVSLCTEIKKSMISPFCFSRRWARMRTLSPRCVPVGTIISPNPTTSTC